MARSPVSNPGCRLRAEALGAQRSWWLVVLALLGGVLGPLPLAGAETEARPFAVVDLHVDLSYQVNYKSRPPERGSGQLLASELRSSGVMGLVLPLYVPHEVAPGGPRLADLEQSYRHLYDVLGRTPPYARPGCRGAPQTVKTWLAFEGSAPLARDPNEAVRWVERGVRLFGLVHSHDNVLATSSGTGPTFRPPAGGLTERGRAVVARVHELGALVDVSHASDAATHEITEMARQAGVPVVATHSNARALAPHPRNLTDEQIRAIAATGGLIGINFHGPFLNRTRPARIGDVVAHIRHVAKLVGIEHVAIGSDFEGGIRPPPGLGGVGGFQTLARALLDSGMTHEEVSRVMARNAWELLCRGDAGQRESFGRGCSGGS